MKQKNPDLSLNAHIGAQLRLFRLSRGLSQRQVAEAVGVSFQQLQKYERGANRLSVEKMVQIARYMRVPPVAFFITNPDDASDGTHSLHALQADTLQLLQHYTHIPDSDKRQTVVKIAKWLS